MKSCPKCSRTFPDEGQKFCTFDGGLLMAPETFDPNVTIRASPAEVMGTSAEWEKPTSRDLPDPEATIAAGSNAPTVTFPHRPGRTTGPTTADFGQAPIPPPPAVAAPAAPVAVAAPKKKSKLPWILVGLLLLLLLGGGALAAVFFVVVKPRLAEMSRRGPVAENRPSRVENTNKSPVSEATPAEVPKPPIEADTFVPPPDAAKFTSSKDKLDGKLAEHFVNFSFYYPRSWVMDPKAGVAGASNFVKVERRVPPDFTQENFAVGWYTSQGTFASDLPSYPQLVERLGANLAKNFPDYRKVSEGPTRVNKMDAYEFRFISLSKGTEKGDIQLWGRVVFLPPNDDAEKTGATLIMLSTSLAPELSGVEDVGEKGQMPIILESFRFGKKQ